MRFLFLAMTAALSNVRHLIVGQGLGKVAAGRTNQQIGQVLFITPKTVSIHVSRILAKLGVAGRGEAAAIAHRLGLDKR